MVIAASVTPAASSLARTAGVKPRNAPTSAQPHRVTKCGCCSAKTRSLTTSSALYPLRGEPIGEVGRADGSLPPASWFARRATWSCLPTQPQAGPAHPRQPPTVHSTIQHRRSVAQSTSDKSGWPNSRDPSGTQGRNTPNPYIHIIPSRCGAARQCKKRRNGKEGGYISRRIASRDIHSNCRNGPHVLLVENPCRHQTTVEVMWN